MYWITNFVIGSVFFLTNSQDKQYRALLCNMDGETYGLSFYMHGRLKSNVTIKKSAFHSAETIRIVGEYYKPRFIGKVTSIFVLISKIVTIKNEPVRNPQAEV